MGSVAAVLSPADDFSLNAISRAWIIGCDIFHWLGCQPQRSVWLVSGLARCINPKAPRGTFCLLLCKTSPQARVGGVDRYTHPHQTTIAIRASIVPWIHPVVFCRTKVSRPFWKPPQLCCVKKCRRVSPPLCQMKQCQVGAGAFQHPPLF